jgi:asparagine synthase (glutamine-hydrolysing)
MWSSRLARYDPGHTGVPVRVRHPFFDVRLVRYLRAVPPVPWFVDKHLLRAAMRDVLPEPVRLRPKTPLARDMLHAVALRQGPPRWMEELAVTPELAPYVDRDELLRGLRSPGQMPGHEYRPILRALSLADWLRKQRRLRAEPDVAGVEQAEFTNWGNDVTDVVGRQTIGQSGG